MPPNLNHETATDSTGSLIRIKTVTPATGLATTACDVTGWSKDEFVCNIGRQQIDGVGSTQPVKQLTTMAHIRSQSLFHITMPYLEIMWSTSIPMVTLPMRVTKHQLVQDITMLYLL
jgi:hypothetical protein